MTVGGLLTVMLLGSISISVLLQNLLLNDSIIIEGMTPGVVSLTYLLVGMVWFFLGASVQAISPEGLNRKIIFLPAVVLLLCVIANLNEGLILDYKSISSEKAGDLEISHLTIGSYAVIASLMAIAFFNRPFKLIACVVGALLFFFLGGRANLFIFILTCGIFYLPKLGLTRSVIVFFALALFSVALLFVFNFDLTDPQVQKMIFYDGISQDQSEVARDIFFQGALEGLSRQALYGDPAYLIEKFYSLGAYSHNLLSAWQFFGMVPFFIFSTSIVYVLRKIISHRSVLKNPMDEFGVLLFIFCVISVVFAKSINFNPFWMALGFWLFRLSGVKFKKHRPI